MTSIHTSWWGDFWRRVLARTRYSLTLVFSCILKFLRWHDVPERRALRDIKEATKEATQSHEPSSEEPVFGLQDLEREEQYVDDLRSGKIKLPSGQTLVTLHGHKTHINLVMEKDFTAIPLGWHIIAVGSSGAIFLMKGRVLNDGGKASVLKVPHWHEPLAGRELEIECEIYRRVGPHPRLVHMRWGSSRGICFEYLPNGNLRAYLKEHPNIAEDIRLRWASEAAEGLQLLHGVGVIHSDTTSKNFLLDNDLGLKIADFAGSSLDGSEPTGFASPRSAPVAKEGGNFIVTPSVQSDLSSLGAVIFEIMTGKQPHQDLPSDEVELLYGEDQFPDVTDLPCGRVIRGCWQGQFDSALQVHEAMELIRTQSRRPSSDLE